MIDDLPPDLVLEFQRLDNLDSQVTALFGYFMEYNQTKRTAEVVLGAAREKAVMEDRLGFARTGHPMDEEKRRQRRAIMAGLECFIESGDMRQFVAVIRSHLTPSSELP